jgi:hypothetical protein
VSTFFRIRHFDIIFAPDFKLGGGFQLLVYLVGLVGLVCLMQSICRNNRALVAKNAKRKLIKEKEPKRKLIKKRDWDNII